MIKISSNLVLFFWVSECAGLNQVTSTFWDGARSLPVGGQAAIPHLKEHIHIFHMTPIA